MRALARGRARRDRSRRRAPRGCPAASAPGAHFVCARVGQQRRQRVRARALVACWRASVAACRAGRPRRRRGWRARPARRARRGEKRTGLAQVPRPVVRDRWPPRRSAGAPVQRRDDRAARRGSADLAHQRRGTARARLHHRRVEGVRGLQQLRRRRRRLRSAAREGSRSRSSGRRRRRRPGRCRRRARRLRAGAARASAAAGAPTASRPAAAPASARRAAPPGARRRRGDITPASAAAANSPTLWPISAAGRTPQRHPAGARARTRARRSPAA